MNAVDVESKKVRVPSVVLGGILAEGTFEDPQNARIIYLAVGGLLLLAIVLGVGTWYWWRTSKVEHPALGPLEMMGTRTWRKGDFNSRVRHLEDARPANAIHEAEPVDDPDELDLDALGKQDLAQFDDFSDLLPADAGAAPVALVAAATASEAPADVQPEVAAETAAEPAVDASDAPVAETVPDAPEAVETSVPEVAEAVDEPVVAPAKQGVIVIDTAPSSAPAQQLTFEEPAAEPADDDDDPDHFDPLLRLNISE
ncbi:MAG: hypothetical protein ABL982_14285 [Vicinamibacterales bacterium]